MRTGFIVSAIAHLVLIGWGVISLRAFEPLDASVIESVPVEFVDLTEVSSFPIGLRSAEEVDEPSPNDPSDIVAEDPDPTPEPPEAEPEPPVPPPPPPPEPETESLPEPEPEPEPEPVVEPDPEPAAAPDPTVEPEPPPEQTQIEPPLPRSRPPAPPSQSDEFTDDIAALLDTTRSASAPAPSEQQATIGAVTGSPFSKLQQNEIDALRARLAACWNLPPTSADPAELRVKIKIFLSTSGTLTGQPEVVSYRPTQVGQVAAESAIRAVQQCAPYNLPVEKYDSWKEIIVTFDPREMFGG